MDLKLSVFVRNEEEINTDPIGLADELFNIKDPQPGFDLLSIGGEGNLGYQFTRTLRGSTGVQVSFNDFRNVKDSVRDDTSEDATDDNILLIQFAQLRWDTSDNPLNPTKGHVLRGRVEHSNKAVISDESFVKLLADPTTRHLLGAHILGSQASLLIQPLVQGMKYGQTVDEMARVIYIHPALTEVVEQALLEL